MNGSLGCLARPKLGDIYFVAGCGDASRTKHHRSSRPVNNGIEKNRPRMTKDHVLI
uniref:Uncharacterized protein n=1 Tax=Hyaloperonospora arabidopsidis (strain Emoy2) TaxID=559515 RepID=M4C0P5_HYAAE